MARMKLPPLAGRVRPTKPGPRSSYLDKLATIKEADDREWRELARFVSERGASHALHRIRHGQRSIPLGKWEFRTERVVGTDTSFRSRLLVRYQGRGKQIAWWRGEKVKEARTHVKADGTMVGAGEKKEAA